MGLESSDVVRLDLGLQIQGEIWIAKFESDDRSLIN